MRRTTLADLSTAEVAAAFTLVYRGYLIPFALGEAAARQHLAANDIAADHSPLWLDDDGAVVALAALGRRGARGWVGGFGVAPDHRGRGLAHELIGATLDAARGRGLAAVQLEVLTGNARAIRTYARAGFAHTRDLRILSRPADAPDAGGAAPPLHPADPAELLAHAPRLRPVAPPWQREMASFAGLAGLALGSPAAPDGYVIYREGAGGASILDFAAPDAEAAGALATALPRALPGRALRLANEPDDSPVCAALAASGWGEVLRQHEMVIGL